MVDANASLEDRLGCLESLLLESALPEDAPPAADGFPALKEVSVRRSPESLVIAFSARKSEVRLAVGGKIYRGGCRVA